MQSPDIDQPYKFRLSRRRFLALTAFTLGGAAAYGALRPSSTPQASGAQDVASPYFSEAVSVTNSRVWDTDTQNSIKRILENIDQQGISNFTIFNSLLFPGVSFPVTEVDINKTSLLLRNKTSLLLRNKIYSEVIQKDQVVHPSQRIYLVLPAFSWPPSGHPFTPWDLIYDRTFRSLPKAATEQVKIIVLGSPNSLWGTVSQDWIKRLNEEGLIPYTDLFKEYLEISLPITGRSNTKIVMQGVSQGAAVAKFLAEDIAEGTSGFKSLQLRLDNPIGLQTHPSLSPAKAQIGLGFLAEAAIFVFTDRGKSILRDEKTFYEKARPVLAQKGIHPQDDETQNALKLEAVKADITNLLNGPAHPLKDKVRSYVLLGRFDPLTLGRSNHLENSFQITTNSTHSIDWFRVSRWRKIIISLT